MFVPSHLLNSANGRVRKRHVDHIQQNAVPRGIESNQYSIPGEDESRVVQPNAATDASEVPNRYPARNRRD